MIEAYHPAPFFLTDFNSGANKSAGKIPALPSRVGSFYRWLHRWHSETNDLHACTGYFARKQKVTERTVYRWLAVLRLALIHI